MKRKTIFIALISLCLTGCVKTNELYGRSQYNSVNFDDNYYTSWSGVDKNLYSELNLEVVNYKNQKVSYDPKPEILDLDFGVENFNPSGLYYRDLSDKKEETEFGYNNCLSKTTNNKEFKYGIISKLFDGRMWCEGRFQLSRVQLNYTGFAMNFSKKLQKTDYISFSLRGGTNFKDHEFGETSIDVDISLSFYRKQDNKNQRVSFNFANVAIPVDDNNRTSCISFMPGTYLEEESFMFEAMSFEWKLSAQNERVSDDFNVKEKHHMALMLYEIILGQSNWR